MEKDCVNILKGLCDESWSNSACLGYVLIGCDVLGYSAENKKQLLSAIEDAFKNYTVESASKIYYKNISSKVT